MANNSRFSELSSFNYQVFCILRAQCCCYNLFIRPKTLKCSFLHFRFVHAHGKSVRVSPSNIIKKLTFQKLTAEFESVPNWTEHLYSSSEAVHLSFTNFTDLAKRSMMTSKNRSM